MSAIFGIVAWDGTPVARDALSHMGQALSRHGSIGPRLWSKGPIGLGCRLQPSTVRDQLDAQPVVGAAGRVVAVADGRLYGRGLGRSASPDAIADSERFLQAYLRWGPDCVHHLDGTFACAVWDSRDQTLFAARSAIVAPSFFYWRHDQRLTFATTPGALHASGLVPRALDEEHLVANMTGVGHEVGDTVYRDVWALPSGATLVASRRGVRVQRFWTPDLRQTERRTSHQSYVHALHDLFEEIVADHLDADSPVSLLLSGGLDSSAIASFAVPQLEARGQRLAAFTEVPRQGFDDAGVRGFYADETSRVLDIAARLPGMHLRLLRTDGATYLDEMPAVFDAFEVPFRNTSNLVWMARAARESASMGCRSMLDGMQGNLTFSFGGGDWLTSLLGAGRYREAAQQVRAHVSRFGAARTAHAASSQVLRRYLPAPLGLAWARLRAATRPAPFSFGAVAPLHPEMRLAFRVDERAREQADADRRGEWTKSARQFIYDLLVAQDFGAYLTGFRALSGVDMRSPTADPRLAEFCLSLPEEQFSLDGEHRSLARRLLAGRLPDSVVNNHQRGMQAADWYERLSHAKPTVEEQLRLLETSDLARHMLDLPRMRTLASRMDPAPLPPEGTYLDYMWTLQGGLMMGGFLRWFESRKKPATEASGF